jgi:small subunit ribosomal protein S20
MANHKSAIKAAKQNIQRRDRNRSNRSRLRTQLKKIRKAVEGGERKEAESMLEPTFSLLDRSVHLGAIHRNTADRTKSRLAKAVRKLAVSA